jgi:aspartyl-tRNA(Asn)/glutamyl-tRNA(Gln) amidotransferase subunit C
MLNYIFSAMVFPSKYQKFQPLELTISFIIKITLRGALLRLRGNFGASALNRWGRPAGNGFPAILTGMPARRKGFLLVLNSPLQYIIKGGNNLPLPSVREEKYMALTREEVLHVAELARLTLAPDEIEGLTRQLNDILAYVEKLQELDTAAVEPLAHVIPVSNVFREDEVRPGLDRDTALSNAPAREEGAFVVPRVI